jgi:hypothetical protein
MMVFGSGKSEAGEKRSKKKKAVLPVFDSWIVMIGPGGLLLVIPTHLQFSFQFYGWGCKKS